MHDHPSLHPAAALGVDLGASKLVSATLPLVGADGKLPVLVRNQLSNDATPLAVVFQPGLRRELGEAAIDTPASNAQNLVAAFVPRLGAPGEQVGGERGEKTEREWKRATKLIYQPGVRGLSTGTARALSLYISAQFAGPELRPAKLTAV